MTPSAIRNVNPGSLNRELKPHNLENKKLFEKIFTNWNTKTRKEIKNLFEKIDTNDLLQQLEGFGTIAADKIEKHDPLRAIDRLLSLIPHEKIEEVLREKFDTFEEGLQLAKKKILEAKYYLEKVEKKKIPFNLYRKLKDAIQAFVTAIDTLLSAFGITTFFKKPDNEFEARFKVQNFMMLMTLLSTLAGVLVPLIGGSLSAGLIIGGSLLALGIVTAIYINFLKPAPEELPGNPQNWSKQAQLGTLQKVEGRQKEVHQIAMALKTKNHAMLVGRSGVGKTETVKALVHAIERGKYPSLKGKKVFYINTADLVTNTGGFWGDGEKILKKIVDAMGRHRKQYILVFDEIHLACQKGKHSVLGERLKTMLDPGNKEAFHRVIGLTTEEEYFRDIYLNNAAFARRFKKITLGNTNEDKTLTILNAFLLKNFPNTLVKEGAIHYLLEQTLTKFKGKPQPLTALNILSDCVRQTNEMEKTQLEKDVFELKEKIESLISQGAVSANFINDKKGDIDALQIKLSAEELKLDKQNQAIKKLHKTKRSVSKIKKVFFKTVLKLDKIRKKTLTKTQKNQLKRFLFIGHFLQPALINSLQQQSNQFKVHAMIDKKLIDSVINQELLRQAEMEKMVEQGKISIDKRKA